MLENETRRLIGWLPGGPGGHVAGSGAPSGGPWESEGALAPTAKQNRGSPSDPVVTPRKLGWAGVGAQAQAMALVLLGLGGVLAQLALASQRLGPIA